MNEESAPSIEVRDEGDGEFWRKSDIINYFKWLATDKELQEWECTAAEAYDDMAMKLTLLVLEEQ